MNPLSSKKKDEEVCCCTSQTFSCSFISAKASACVVIVKLPRWPPPKNPLIGHPINKYILIFGTEHHGGERWVIWAVLGKGELFWRRNVCLHLTSCPHKSVPDSGHPQREGPDTSPAAAITLLLCVYGTVPCLIWSAQALSGESSASEGTDGEGEVARWRSNDVALLPEQPQQQVLDVVGPAVDPGASEPLGNVVLQCGHRVILLMLRQIDGLQPSSLSVLLITLHPHILSGSQPSNWFQTFRTQSLNRLFAHSYLCCIGKQHWHQPEVAAALLDELVLDLYPQKIENNLWFFP